MIMPLSVIPAEIASLMVAYFCHTATEQQREQLDEWVCKNEDNMQVFENCLKESLKPKAFDPDRMEEYFFSYDSSDN